VVSCQAVNSGGRPDPVLATGNPLVRHHHEHGTDEGNAERGGSRGHAVPQSGPSRRKQVSETDAVIEVGPDQVADAVAGFGAVVGGVDVDTEGTPALWGVDHAHDRAGDFFGVGVGGGQLCEFLRDLVHQAGVALFVGGGDVLVGGVAGVGEVVGAVGEGAGDDDGL
jgi:hypothetical protein